MVNKLFIAHSEASIQIIPINETSFIHTLQNLLRRLFLLVTQTVFVAISHKKSQHNDLK